MNVLTARDYSQREGLALLLPSHLKDPHRSRIRLGEPRRGFDSADLGARRGPVNGPVSEFAAPIPRRDAPESVTIPGR